ncbi:hypothetical protein NMY22_g10733 [Coprinellus aureogranulatus]|nr:hypothetical protein NMY22_g10733 [Coprinellus aureogranulatus]
MEDVYEQQNDQRLDELHSKLRTLKGITTDIHADVESQNLMIDSTSDRFASFGGQLSQASLRARQAFGIGPGAGTLKPWRIAMLIVALFITFWLGGKTSEDRSFLFALMHAFMLSIVHSLMPNDDRLPLRPLLHSGGHAMGWKAHLKPFQEGIILFLPFRRKL